jgi:hypothetical protein
MSKITNVNDKYGYAILDNGYDIYINNELVITQHDQYSKIYKPDGSYEDNAKAQINDLIEGEKQANIIDNLKNAVKDGSITKEQYKSITGQEYEEDK